METSPKKFQAVEIIIVVLFFTLPTDVIAIIMDIFGLNLGWTVQIATWLILSCYLYFRGAKVTAGIARRFVIPLIAQLLPDWLVPLNVTLTYLITVYMENRPEKFGSLTSVAAVAQGKKAAMRTQGSRAVKLKAAREAYQQELKQQAEDAGFGKLPRRTEGSPGQFVGRSDLELHRLQNLAAAHNLRAPEASVKTKTQAQKTLDQIQKGIEESKNLTKEYARELRKKDKLRGVTTREEFRGAMLEFEQNEKRLSGGDKPSAG
jgi:hypothetical protein